MIIIYTKPFCGYSRTAVQLLSEKGIEFEERLVEDLEEMLRLKNECGWRTFPIIYVKDRLIGGYTECRRMWDSGELFEIMKAEEQAD